MIYKLYVLEKKKICLMLFLFQIYILLYQYFHFKSFVDDSKRVYTPFSRIDKSCTFSNVKLQLGWKYCISYVCLTKVETLKMNPYYFQFLHHFQSIQKWFYCVMQRLIVWKGMMSFFFCSSLSFSNSISKFTRNKMMPLSSSECKSSHIHILKFVGSFYIYKRWNNVTAPPVTTGIIELSSKINSATAHDIPATIEQLNDKHAPFVTWEIQKSIAK